MCLSKLSGIWRDRNSVLFGLLKLGAACNILITVIIVSQLHNRLVDMNWKFDESIANLSMPYHLRGDMANECHIYWANNPPRKVQNAAIRVVCPPGRAQLERLAQLVARRGGDGQAASKRRRVDANAARGGARGRQWWIVAADHSRGTPRMLWNPLEFMEIP